MKVLIVDDSAVMRKLVRRGLRQAGFDGIDVEEAADGSEALPMLRDDDYDVVISDWNMPEMNGIDLLKTLRAEGNEVVFGFITSEAEGPMSAQATEAGATFFVTKPFTPDSLAEAVAVPLG
jgi:two-component system chemotaxis response regulator CheY